LKPGRSCAHRLKKRRIIENGQPTGQSSLTALISEAAGVTDPVREDVQIMVIEEARLNTNV
jgi:hypothetical protein